MREVDLVALAGLLHDIGKFGQRAEVYRFEGWGLKKYDYKYTHASYTAQILNDLAFNIGEELSDAAATHHNPQSDLSWIVAAADRMASGFEREKFKNYNEKSDKEDFTKQRLWHLFDEGKRFKIDILSPENIFAQENKPVANEYDGLWRQFEEEMKKIKEKGNGSIDFFTIDYLMKKFTTFIPSATSFKNGEFDALKANIPLYEHSKATAIFAAAIYSLKKGGNENIINYFKNVDSSDPQKNDLLMICGDFFGIQKFIFDSVPAQKASKILRAKSAYIQILTKVIAFAIVEKLGLSYQSIISTNAGKFEILGVNDDATKEKLKEIQKELDKFFIERYFGETGVGVSFAQASLSDFIVLGQYKDSLRPKIDAAVEAVKFNKFDLANVEAVLEYESGIDNQNLCPLCSKRKKQVDGEFCGVCDSFVQIGEELAKSGYLIISKGFGQIHIFGDFYISFSDEPKVYKQNDIAIFDTRNDEKFRGYAKWELASYVKKNSDGQIATFEDLAKQSCGGGEIGLKAMMSLKGDVDGMGEFIKNEKNEITNSFARFNFFARMVDYFFSVYTSKMMEGKNIYTVFAGGDDIFILGAWDEVIEFAKELRGEFVKFAQGSPLTISMGLVLTKPNKPVNFIAHIAEDGLEEAKSLEKKDGISMFGETVKWDDYLDDLGLGEALRDVDENVLELNTAFLYRLLYFTQMSKEAKKGDVEATMWKSKLRYSFNRNIYEKISKNGSVEKADNLLDTLAKMIEKYPQETKMVLSEFIYKRRD